MNLTARVPSIPALAKACGCSRQHAWEVLTGRTQASAKMAIRFERGSNYAIGRHELRPDLWPEPVREKVS